MKTLYFFSILAIFEKSYPFLRFLSNFDEKSMQAMALNEAQFLKSLRTIGFLLSGEKFPPDNITFSFLFHSFSLEDLFQ